MTTPKSVRIELAASLAGLRGTNCFCENGIGNPMYGGECSRACIAASNALARHAAEPDNEPLLLALLRAARKCRKLRQGQHVGRPYIDACAAADRERDAAIDACNAIVLPPEEETHGPR